MKYLILLFYLSSWYIVTAQDGSSEISYSDVRQFLDHEPEEEFQKGIPVGAVFSDSTFISTTENEVSFTNTKYKLTVVDFWFKGCTGCKQEKPYVKHTIQKFKDDPRIRFVAITPSSERAINKIIKKYGDYYADIISVDGFKSCEELFRFKSFPRHVLVDQNGKVLANYTIPIFHPDLMAEYEKRISNFLDTE